MRKRQWRPGRSVLHKIRVAASARLWWWWCVKPSLYRRLQHTHTASSINKQHYQQTTTGKIYTTPAKRSINIQQINTQNKAANSTHPTRVLFQVLGLDDATVLGQPHGGCRRQGGGCHDRVSPQCADQTNNSRRCAHNSSKLVSPGLFVVCLVVVVACACPAHTTRTAQHPVVSFSFARSLLLVRVCA
jgi:hypothetical protein